MGDYDLPLRVMPFEMGSVILVSALFVYGFIWLGYSTRYRIYLFAFNGMQKSDAKEVYNIQCFASKILMLYLINCNPTEYHSRPRVMFSIACHYAHAIITALVIFTGWIDRWPNLLMYSARLYLVIPFIPIVLIRFLPQKTPSNDDVISIERREGEKEPGMFATFFRDYGEKE